MPGYEPRAGSGEQAPWRQSPRARLFAVVFGLVLLTGVCWTLFQPVVYRSSATVLMSAPVTIDAAVAETNLQGLAIQRTKLLGQDVTHRVLEEVSAQQDIHLGPDNLREVLRVDPVPDTNLIELVAQGADKELLPTLVATWIRVYSELRAASIAQSKAHTIHLVQEEIDGLATKIEQSRQALEDYRQLNSIISVKREENEVLARLAGLNRALNNAVEEEVRAKVQLASLRELITRGQVIIPDSERRSMQSLEGELEQLRNEMVELSKRYTREYIQKQPALRAIPQRIVELEKEVASRISTGQAAELARAEQEYSAARRAVVELQEKLDQHKQAVANFNRVYATHQALEDDLARLEEMNREAQARLAQVEIRQVEKYPQVSVIEPPARDSHRIGPDYLVLLGSTLAIALGCGILSVWLYRFLGHEQAQPAYVTLSGVHLYPQEVSGELAYATAPDPRLAQAGQHLLQEDKAGSGGSGSAGGEQ